uniref:Uncharacterized protein n=1 Tax=Peronospora matthiolae TaxID=2874970 RepID=A0AAV1U9L0_9STRA
MLYPVFVAWSTDLETSANNSERIASYSLISSDQTQTNDASRAKRLQKLAMQRPVYHRLVSTLSSVAVRSLAAERRVALT